MKPALVISTYNEPKFLGLCLEALCHQTYDSFDVFIADDGSTDETRDKILSFQNRLPGKLEHCWHADNGKFEKAKIHNEVFRKIKDYPITICFDGDTIAHHRFVEDHVSVHQKYSNLCFMGRRVELGPQITKELTESMIPNFQRGLSFELFKSGLKNDSRCLTRAVRVETPILQKILLRDQVKDLIGSNFSVQTNILFKINGYDERFDHYWGEDGDLFVRIRNSGAKLLGLKSFAIQYHLFHGRRTFTKEMEEEYFRMLQDKTTIRCEHGINS